MSAQEIADALRMVIPPGDPADTRQPLRRSYGVVSTLSPSFSVTLDGGSVAIAMPKLTSYSAKVGDFVAVDVGVAGDYLCIGEVESNASDWTPLSRAAGWGANPFGWNDVRYVIEGRWVSIEGLFYRSGGIVTGAQTLGTLPVGARPVTSCPLPVGWSNQSAAVSWSVDNAGNVATRADAGFLASFPTGSFMGVSGRFPID